MGTSTEKIGHFFDDKVERRVEGHEPVFASFGNSDTPLCKDTPVVIVEQTSAGQNKKLERRFLFAVVDDQVGARRTASGHDPQTFVVFESSTDL